jgi:hypothetical protein
MKTKLFLTIIFILANIACFSQCRDSIPAKNKCVIDTIVKYGPIISPTYKKAVCTELLIKIIEKFYSLDKTDKKRIRIITDKDIPTLLRQDSPVPKGVYYALISKNIGIAIDNLCDVQSGDFVQFWTDTWGHCGVVKSINLDNQTMELYSSFPSTNGYGIQLFRIPKYCYFVRLK